MSGSPHALWFSEHQSLSLSKQAGINEAESERAMGLLGFPYSEPAFPIVSPLDLHGSREGRSGD